MAPYYREIVAAEEYSQVASSFSLVDDEKYLARMFTNEESQCTKRLKRYGTYKVHLAKNTLRSAKYLTYIMDCTDMHGLQTLTVYGDSSMCARLYNKFMVDKCFSLTRWVERQKNPVYHHGTSEKPTKGASISSLMATRVYPQAIHAVVINTGVFPKIKIASSDNPLDVTMLYMHLEHEEQYHHIVADLYAGYMPNFLFFNIMKSMSASVDSNEIQRLNEVYKTHRGLTSKDKISGYFIPDNRQSLTQAESLCSFCSFTMLEQREDGFVVCAKCKGHSIPRKSATIIGSIISNDMMEYRVTVRDKMVDKIYNLDEGSMVKFAMESPEKIVIYLFSKPTGFFLLNEANIIVHFETPNNLAMEIANNQK
ncbi:hypothetical protein SELMODRAFT_426231 [Selaginella moellendorffii]|uniref:Uncharacterized protein n=1 Tax=Selaginella moellendorffii TaxID=88036 RepID=D8SVS0_SELML|nr:hypothetical protein SELMODRAFT_426231 [Selaginella moellendorffii]